VLGREHDPDERDQSGPKAKFSGQFLPNSVRLTKQAMAEVETHVQRLIGLERWFVDISCAPPALPDA